jgi:hypothetical protein
MQTRYMHVIGIGSSSYLKDLKLSKFSDIWTIDKTYNKSLAQNAF